MRRLLPGLIALTTLAVLGGAAGCSDDDYDGGSTSGEISATVYDLSALPDLLGADLTPSFGCKSLVNCDSATCMVGDSACYAACYAKVNTAMGTTLYSALLTCIGQQCTTGAGGICDTKAANYNAANCTTCIKTAQAGACMTQNAACANDG